MHENKSKLTRATRASIAILLSILLAGMLPLFGMKRAHALDINYPSSTDTTHSNIRYTTIDESQFNRLIYINSVGDMTSAISVVHSNPTQKFALILKNNLVFSSEITFRTGNATIFGCGYKISLGGQATIKTAGNAVLNLGYEGAHDRLDIHMDATNKEERHVAHVTVTENSRVNIYGADQRANSTNIANNNAVDAPAGGISVHDSATLYSNGGCVWDNKNNKDKITYAAGGVLVDSENATLNLKKISIVRNWAWNGDGGGILAPAGKVITNDETQIENNRASFKGGGIFIGGKANFYCNKLENLEPYTGGGTWVTHNNATEGGGFYVDAKDSSPSFGFQLLRARIYANKADKQGSDFAIVNHNKTGDVKLIEPIIMKCASGDGWFDTWYHDSEADRKASGTPGEYNFENEIGAEKYLVLRPGKKRGVEYKFESATDWKYFNDDVRALLPVDYSVYSAGTVINAKMPSKTVVQDGTGKWTFLGWDMNTRTITKDADAVFTGKWEWKEDPGPTGGRWRIWHNFKSITKDKPLSGYVRAFEPYDKNKYALTDDMKPTMPEYTKLKEPDADGWWKFEGYENNFAVDTKKEWRTYTGNWSWHPDSESMEDQFSLIHKWVSGTPGKELPKEITDMLPVDKKKYVAGSENMPITPNIRQVNVAGGHWYFEGYDIKVAKFVDKDITCTGTWKFYADPKVNINVTVKGNGKAVANEVAKAKWNLVWNSGLTGNNINLIKSIKVDGIEKFSVVNVNKDEWKVANAEYKRRMKEDYKLVDFSKVKATIEKGGTLEIDGTQYLTGDGDKTINVEVEFQELVPVFRLYNMLSSEHLFTTDKAEYDNWVAIGKKNKDWWIGEGIDWFAPTMGKNIYRLYNPGLGKLGRTSHYYTGDLKEIERLTTKWGWIKEKQFPNGVFKSGGDAPVFTCYNEALKSAHHYTSDLDEYLGLEKHGWDLEVYKNFDRKKGKWTGFFNCVMSAK